MPWKRPGEMRPERRSSSPRRPWSAPRAKRAERPGTGWCFLTCIREGELAYWWTSAAKPILSLGRKFSRTWERNSASRLLRWIPRVWPSFSNRSTSASRRRRWRTWLAKHPERWDKTIITDIEKALRVQNFSPVVDETMIRVALPSLTGEEREKIVKEVGVKIEEAKVGLRFARRGEVERIESAQKNKEISEDEEFSQKKPVDQLLEKYGRRIDEISQEKVAQLQL